MQMWHLLARVWPLVYHQPIAAFIYVELFGQGYACVKEAAQHLEMFCRFIAEGADVGKGDGGTCFIAGSHKVNFPMHPDHTSWEERKRSDFFVNYECPAGSALFFTENVCHAGPEWKRDTPRIAVLHAYAHLATHWHRLQVPPEVLAGLPREKQAYFREPWMADFLTLPARKNTIERFVESGEPPISTEWVTSVKQNG